MSGDNRIKKKSVFLAALLLLMLVVLVLVGLAARSGLDNAKYYKMVCVSESDSPMGLMFDSYDQTNQNPGLCEVGLDAEEGRCCSADGSEMALADLRKGDICLISGAVCETYPGVIPAKVIKLVEHGGEEVFQSHKEGYEAYIKFCEES